MPLILGANSVTGGYEVDNSLRFNSGSSDSLTRTPATLVIEKLGLLVHGLKEVIISGDQAIFFLAYTSSTDQVHFFYK
jgi:hypothetical protein